VRSEAIKGTSHPNILYHMIAQKALSMVRAICHSGFAAFGNHK